ncbi:MAG: type II toxin-antitoxin system VapC family toxin [Candidatus Eremiobacterota bacterium]|mgnify:CR=1 FL=1
MIYVLDSCSLIAFLWDEPGSDLVEPLLMSSATCFVHIINLCEVYYDLLRRTEAVKVEKLLKNITDLVIVRNDMDFWKEAGKYKAELKRISLADCFCIALAKKIGATVVTSDHHEFDKVSILGIVPVLFIR